jgi:hypothetical protein
LVSDIPAGDRKLVNLFLRCAVIRRFLAKYECIHIIRAVSIGQAEPLVAVSIKYIYRTIPPERGDWEGNLVKMSNIGL